MHKILQTRTGAPHGNCHMACLASVFEVPLDAVPDHRWPDDVPWQEAQDATLTSRGQAVRDARYQLFQDWLAARGLTSSVFPYTAGGWAPRGYALGGVTNPRGLPHYVVCLDGRIVWDPSPAQDSYDAPIELFEFFIALDPARLVVR